MPYYNEHLIRAAERNADIKREEEIRKKQNRHDWLIALFSILGGTFSGFVTSLVFWLIEKG